MAEWLEKINIKTKFCFKWNFAYQYTSLENEIKSKKAVFHYSINSRVKVIHGKYGFLSSKKVARGSTGWNKVMEGNFYVYFEKCTVSLLSGP